MFKSRQLIKYSLSFEMAIKAGEMHSEFFDDDDFVDSHASTVIYRAINGVEGTADSLCISREKKSQKEITQ